MLVFALEGERSRRTADTEIAGDSPGAAEGAAAGKAYEGHGTGDAAGAKAGCATEAVDWKVWQVGVTSDGAREEIFAWLV